MSLLWLLSALLLVVGVVRLAQRDFMWGVILIAVGLIIGPASSVGLL